MPAPTSAPVIARALGEDVVLELGADADDLADVRSAVERLAPVELAPGDVRSALGAATAYATLTPDADLASRHPAISQMKLVVRKLTFFVAHSLAVQVTDLAHALLVAGAATADRLELMEAENARLRQDLDALRRRVDQDLR